MTVRELIEMLQGYEPDREVRIAYQPNHPLQSSIENVLTIKECPRPSADLDDEDDEDEGVVFIVSGAAFGHTTSSFWR